ncbi:hypothetical protein R1N_40000 [Enterobacter asburiae]|nr:hypothetical protein EAA2563_38560 [Enterobacter asburiae]BCP71813.1 hypothetical protein R1N_40000 [Enterobacter asburiae]BCT20589.1 hypothetical protein R2TS_37610 [Enterobacter asburiae]
MDFVRFMFVFQDPVVITLRIEDEWLKMKRRGAESGGSLRWLTFGCDSDAPLSLWERGGVEGIRPQWA